MGYGAPQVVEAQPRIALPFGLFSVVALREASDPHWTNGVEWQAVSCDPVTAQEWQDDPDCDTEIENFFRGPAGTGRASAFTAVGSFKCGTPAGRAFQEGEENAVADLLAHEQSQVESATWRRMAAEATDLNPGGALDMGPALAALEDWIGQEYGALGVIHGTRGAVSVMDTRVSSSGSRLATKVGTPVVAGAGYRGTSPTNVAAAVGETWVYASPALFGYRGQVFTTTALDRAKNDHYAIATRQYVVGFDPCGVAAVRMNLA